MHLFPKNNEIKDILVIAFLREGLASRNRALIKCQEEVSSTLLARRNDLSARKKSYRVLILLEKAISSDYNTPTHLYQTSLHIGKKFLEQNASDVEFAMRYPRVSKRLFRYLKERLSKMRPNRARE
ncbi:MAG: hypothetical protein SPL08_02465 [Pseudomonadota bacterium]|nr:hypothetical protein [Pseudomonadota bacterium]